MRGREAGASLAEAALVLALIAVLAFAAVRFFGGSVGGLWDDTASTIDDPTVVTTDAPADPAPAGGDGGGGGSPGGSGGSVILQPDGDCPDGDPDDPDCTTADTEP